MVEPKLPNNCLLKKTKDLLDINLFKETLNKFKISEKCLLIVDTRGAKFINNFFSLTEVINKGIVSIESIYINRRPFKTYDAIYLISGNSNVLKKIIEEDFGQKQLYKSCHIFIIDEIKNELYDYIIEHKKFLKYIKSFKQVLIKYVTIDKNLFSYGDDINFNSIYNLMENIKKIDNLNISRLFSICKALNVNPNIIYFNKDKKCQSLAEQVNKELKKSFSKKKKEGFLLITSRFIDFVAPLQFNDIYQNLLLEAFKIKDVKYCNKISIDGVGKDNYILDYKDELYNKYRCIHLDELGDLIYDDLKAFKESEVGKTMANIDKEISTAAKNISKYKSYSQKISEHLNLSQKLLNIQKERNLLNIIDLQDTIISKINKKGKNISESDIISLIKENKFNNKQDLMRLLCFIKYNFSELNLDKIYNIINSNIKFSSNDKNLIDFFSPENNPIDPRDLDNLDSSIVSYREETNYNTKRDNEKKDDKRYVYMKESKLTTLCDMCCKNQLPSELFTYVEKPENLKVKKKYLTKFDHLINKTDEEENKQYLILFNLGGLSNFEISSLERGEYLEQYDMNLILGGNKIYNYEEYFNEIKDYNAKTNLYKETEEKDEKNNYGKKDSKISIKMNDYKNNGSKEAFKRNEDENTFEDDYK